MHGSEVPGEKGGNEAEVTFEEITAKKKKKKKVQDSYQITCSRRTLSPKQDKDEENHI